MALRLISCTKHETNQKRKVVIEADTIEELLATPAKELANAAGGESGLGSPGISDSLGTYPVDAEGKTDDDLLLGRRTPVAAYRQDFIVMSAR